jgi:hypothetical protein
MIIPVSLPSFGCNSEITSYIAAQLLSHEGLPSSSDQADGRDSDASVDTTSSIFARNANSKCVFCWETTGKKTAEVLYMSQQWDYYYCYSCRGWFKRRFDNPKVFLPVKDKTDIRHLTWFYVAHMQSVYERTKFRDRVENVWHQFLRGG